MAVPATAPASSTVDTACAAIREAIRSGRFVGGDRIRALYADLAARFPLPPEVVRLYTGPGTTRERHETAAEPNFFTNGAAELICRLAARID